MPYYLSTLDEKMWRSGLSDMLYLSTWVPGMNEVSSNKNQTSLTLSFNSSTLVPHGRRYV
jgi:hypothetical protein